MVEMVAGMMSIPSHILVIKEITIGMEEVYKEVNKYVSSYI